MEYIKVKNWDKFQAFKDGRPIKWIKLHVALLDDYEFSQLPDKIKLQILLIWLLCGRTNNKIPQDAKWIQSQAHLKSPVNLQALTKTGFIEAYEIVRNRTDSYTEKSREEKSREEEKEKYGEFVFLFKEEYQQLIQTYGEQPTKDLITQLNNGIGSKGYKYKSHYHTIRSWARSKNIPELPQKQKDEAAALTKKRQELLDKYGPWIEGAAPDKLKKFWDEHIELRWIVKAKRPDWRLA